MSINQSTLVGGGNNDTKKERSSNLELYRIIVMLLIVAHHYVVNSGIGLVWNENPLSSSTIFYSIFGAWGKTGINCFVLITGYFMCKSEISLRKFLKLLLWVLTYNILISGIFIITDYHPTESITSLLLNIIPMNVLSDGFVDCFLAFYLCIPFLNVLINNLTRIQHQLLIGLLLFIYTLHAFLGKGVIMNYISWFCVLYFIASYLRFYPLARDKDVRFWGWLTLISWGTSILSIMLVLCFNSMGHTIHHYIFVSDSNTFLALTNGITSFMWFKNLKIKNCKVINTIAASSFGVLLIHANSNTMRQWLWKDVCDCVGHYNASFFWLYAIGCVIAIYTTCTIIDYIRIKTIETPLLNATESLCIRLYNKKLRK